MKIKIEKNGSLFITTHKKLLCRNEMFLYQSNTVFQL